MGTSGPRPRVPSAQKYVVWAATTAFGLFGLLRLPWIEAHVILPMTLVQGDVAAAAFATPAAPISVTLACSGTEVIAMCLGAILAYPASWRSRLSGAVVVVLGILALNTVRIGTLGLAASNQPWFDALHLYIWPAALVLATAGAVFIWMRSAERTATATLSPSWRFVTLALLLLVISALTAPLYIESTAVHRVGVMIAHAASALLYAVGGGTYATDNVLWTMRGGFSVTGDCVATPLLPLYLAAVWIYATTWPARLLGIVLAAPIFIGLGVLRLLLVALPQSVAPVPEFASHTFYQVVLACVVVCLAARWQWGAQGWAARAAAGLVAAGVVLVSIGTVYASVLMTGGAQAVIDPQGAVRLLPAFQLALWVALWVAAGRGVIGSRMTAGLVVLILSHVAGAWLFFSRPDVQGFFAGHISVVRAWAILGPVTLFMLARQRTSEPWIMKNVQNSTVSPGGAP